jgi:hypothetical protein
LSTSKNVRRRKLGSSRIEWRYRFACPKHVRLYLESRGGTRAAPQRESRDSQDNLPEIGKKIASTAHREGAAERFAEPAGQKNIAVDLALITYDDTLLQDLEFAILKTAKQHDANTLSLLPTVPGIGKILSLVRLYELHYIARFPRVQDCAS